MHFGFRELQAEFGKIILVDKILFFTRCNSDNFIFSSQRVICVSFQNLFSATLTLNMQNGVRVFGKKPIRQGLLFFTLIPLKLHLFVSGTNYLEVE